ncbi:MAG: 5-(carboxyamino)imidazole ribonucleotide synthase, partial [Thermus sp.]
MAEDRLREQRLHAKARGVPTPAFPGGGDTPAGLEEALARWALPPALQHLARGRGRRQGPGPGAHPEEAEAAFRALGGRQLILLGLVPFTRRLSPS